MLKWAHKIHMPKSKKPVKKTGAYSAESITVLEGLEPVRKRPGMYIGTTGPDGLHHLVTEIFVNSLSIYCRAEVHRDSGIYIQEYSQGKKKSAVKKIGTSKLHGTIITFQPDPIIFPDINFNFERIVNHLRQQAYLVKGLRISVIDARAAEVWPSRKNAEFPEGIFYTRELGLNAPSMSFYFDGGLMSLVRFENEHSKPIHKNIFYVAKNANGNDYETVEVALQYVDDISSRLLPFANNIYTAEGGTHVTGFKTALTRSLNTYARKNNLVNEKEDNFTGDDALEGLTAVISIKLREIQFEGQTKAKLGSVEAQSMVTTIFGEAFSAYLEENPDDARSIIQKVILALKARKAAKAAKDSVLRKGALEGMTLPGKLADCQSRSAEESELFIVEGDSAGGTAKQGRDRRIQAILPLRGKILNIERAHLDRMLASEQIKNLVVAFGTAIGDTFDITKLRYHKIIKGKEIIYVYSDTERDKKAVEGADIQRYKGLGEMNAEELWETTMDPKARILKQVKVEDAREADRIFDILMGSDVPSRKSFIQSNAKKAVLDV